MKLKVHVSDEGSSCTFYVENGALAEITKSGGIPVEKVLYGVDLQGDDDAIKEAVEAAFNEAPPHGYTASVEEMEDDESEEEWAVIESFDPCVVKRFPSRIEAIAYGQTVGNNWHLCRCEREPGTETIALLGLECQPTA